MLHNLAIRQGDMWSEPIELPANEEEEADDPAENPAAENLAGNRVRTQYIQRHFSNNNSCVSKVYCNSNRSKFNNLLIDCLHFRLMLCCFMLHLKLMQLFGVTPLVLY